MILLSLVVYLSFQGYYWWINLRAKAKLAHKPVLIIQGHQFRDLNANGILDTYEDIRQSVDSRVEDLLAQMTTQDKVGMFWHPPIGVGDRGQVLGKPAIISPVSSYDAIINQKVRHFNLYEVPDAKFLARWYNRIQRLAERDKLGIPVTISSDPRNGIHNFLGSELMGGGFSKWPEPIGIAAIGDSSFTLRYAQIISHEMRLVGIRTALHPMADLATEPRWARISGTFGEDAELSARMTSAYIIGFQGAELDSNSVACMTKHWPGGGPQADGEDAHFSYGKNQKYSGDNFRYHLIPFKAAIDVGTAMIMPYYGVPLGQTAQDIGMSFNRKIVNDLLRNEFGYDGVVCTDWGILEGFSLAGLEIVETKDWGVEDLNLEDKMVMAIDAGVDQFGGNNHGKQLMEAIQKGRVTEERLDQSIRRLLKVKFALGLFDNPYVDEQEADKIVGQELYMREGAKAQRKAMVLLKNGKINQKKILPLHEDINLYIENIDPAIASEYGRIVAHPEEADVALIRIHTPWEPRGGFVEQFFHQGSLEIEKEELKRLLSITKKTATVFFIYLDRPAVIPELNNSAAGLIAEFGAYDDAVLDVAFGRSQPTGRLPFEIPSSMQAVVSQYEDVPYDSKEPLYPYGYGLDY